MGAAYGPPPELIGIDNLLEIQDCLMASFEDWEEIEPKDREVMKALGLKFRGRNAWPLFRSFLPGTFPWYLTAAEARYLTICLGQALLVIEYL